MITLRAQKRMRSNYNPAPQKFNADYPIHLLTLIFEIAMRAFIPLTNIAQTSKHWHASIKQTIINLPLFQYQHIRQRLFAIEIPKAEKEELIEGYNLQCGLKISTSQKFICDLLESGEIISKTRVDDLIHDALTLANAPKTNNPIKTLLDHNEIEIAFGLIQAIDNQDFFHPAKEIFVDYLVEKMGFDQALKMTQALNENHTFLYLAFIKNRCNHLKTAADILALANDPFIKFLDTFSHDRVLPYSAIRFIVNSITLLFHSDSTQSTNLINHFLRIIPLGYDFNECDSNNKNLMDAFSEGMFIHTNPAGMPKEQEENLLEWLDSIPHPQLKKRITSTILDDFYMQEPDMRVYWPSINRIETFFEVGMQMTTDGKYYIERATEELFYQLLLTDFSKEFDTLNFDSNAFSQSIIRLFQHSPDWLNGTLAKTPTNEAYPVYLSIFNFLEKKNQKLLKDEIFNYIDCLELRQQLRPKRDPLGLSD